MIAEWEQQADLLAIFLQDHRARASAGLAAARRTAGNNRGTPFEEVLRSLADDIEQDLLALDGILEAVGVERSRAKDGLAALGERVARLKPNGRLRTYSPLSRVLELEALEAGINGKRMLWRSLRGVQPHLADLAPFDFDALEQRAAEQSDRLRPHHDEAARLALVERGGADEPRGRDDEVAPGPISSPRTGPDTSVFEPVPRRPADEDRLQSIDEDTIPPSV